MVGAAILPATIIKNKLYLLFGKENKFEESAPGLSDFGGGVDPNESIFDAAIRESCEEITGFLGSEKEVKNMATKSGTYPLKLDNYNTFILPLIFDPKLTHYYNNNQKYLQRKLPPSVFKSTKIFEKEKIMWVKADDLKHMRHQFRHFYRFMVDKLYNEQLQIKSFVKKGLKKHESKTKRKSQTKIKTKSKSKSKSKLNRISKNKSKKKPR